MAVKLNFNICDNSSECSGIAVCPTKAIYWDEEILNSFSEKGSICVDNGKCISCGNCVGENGCPVGAIIFSNSEDELEKLTEEYETDITKIENLFVERYGATPIDDSLCIERKELKEIIKNNNGIVLIEEFADWSIQCLLSSIPIDTIIEEVKATARTNDINYYRINMTGEVKGGDELPKLNVYQKGKMIFQICGFLDNTQLDMIKELLKKNLK